MIATQAVSLLVDSKSKRYPYVTNDAQSVLRSSNGSTPFLSFWNGQSWSTISESHFGTSTVQMTDSKIRFRPTAVVEYLATDIRTTSISAFCKLYYRARSYASCLRSIRVFVFRECVVCFVRWSNVHSVFHIGNLQWFTGLYLITLFVNSELQLWNASYVFLLCFASYKS